MWGRLPLSAVPAPPQDRTRRGRPRADTVRDLISEGEHSSSRIRCNVCNRVFPREKSLQAHKRTHTGKRGASRGPLTPTAPAPARPSQPQLKCSRGRKRYLVKPFLAGTGRYCVAGVLGEKLRCSPSRCPPLPPAGCLLRVCFLPWRCHANLATRTHKAAPEVTYSETEIQRQLIQYPHELEIKGKCCFSFQSNTFSFKLVCFVVFFCVFFFNML